MTTMTEETDVQFYLILILRPRFDPAIGKLFSMFGTQSRELTLSIVNFIKSKSRSNIPDENLAFKLKCAI